MKGKIKLRLADFDAAIFDMDGTMIDNARFHKQAWQVFAKKHGLALTDQEFRERIFGKKNNKILEILFNGRLTEEEIKTYAEEKEQIYRDLYLHDIREVPGLTTMIKILLAHNKKLAVATTAPEKNRKFGLESLSLTDTFPTILGDEHITRGKPDPEIYLETAKQLFVTPKRCLVFEDSPPGVTAGKNAGMKVVGILTSHSVEELENADYYVRDFTSITFV